MFKRQAGVEMIHVPYKGSGPAMTDLMGGQVLTMVETVPAALPHIRAGKIRPLAVTTAQRISMLPDVPTATEAGLPGFEVSSLFGILAPAGTPKEIITRLNSEITKLLSLPEVKEQLLAQGAFSVTTHTRAGCRPCPSGGRDVGQGDQGSERQAGLMAARALRRSLIGSEALQP